jgi:polyketide biosynthesis acyl carrier protein
MNEEHFLAHIRDAIHAVMQGQVAQQVTPQDSLLQLGAGSRDGVEILMCTMEALNVRMPMSAFAEARNIGDIIDVFTRAFRELE